MWKETLPHRRHAVCDLLCRFPNEVVPLVCKKELVGLCETSIKSKRSKPRGFARKARSHSCNSESNQAQHETKSPRMRSTPLKTLVRRCIRSSHESSVELRHSGVVASCCITHFIVFHVGRTRTVVQRKLSSRLLSKPLQQFRMTTPSRRQPKRKRNENELAKTDHGVLTTSAEDLRFLIIGINSGGGAQYLLKKRSISRGASLCKAGQTQQIRLVRRHDPILDRRSTLRQSRTRSRTTKEKISWFDQACVFTKHLFQVPPVRDSMTRRSRRQTGASQAQEAWKMSKAKAFICSTTTNP